MTIQVRFSEAQTGVGFQFFDATGTLLGSRTTSGVSDGPEAGHYLCDATPPSGSVGVYWDTTEGNTAVEDLRDSLSLAATGAGTGARTVTVTVDDGTDPIEGARVRMTNGVESYTVVTNASGQGTFNLDDATWTVSITKSGYSFGGTTEVVSADTSATYSMTQEAMSAPSDPSLTTAYVDTLSVLGVAVSGLSIYVRPYTMPTQSGTAYISSDRELMTESEPAGRYTASLVRGVRYVAECADLWPKPKDFTTPDADSYDIGS